MWIRKSRCIESNQAHYCIGKFNVALSLCRVLGVALYFSKGFLEAAAKAPQPLEETVDRDNLEEGFLADEATRDEFALFWGAVAGLEVEAFPCFWE